MNNALVGIFTIVLLALLIVFGPLITIWVLNTLFAVGIEYTFVNWVAALLLNITLNRTINVKIKD